MITDAMAFHGNERSTLAYAVAALAVSLLNLLPSGL